MEKHILYSDLDGTLIIGEEQALTISKVNQSAIKKWVEQGNYFSIATGRTLLQVKKIVKDLIPLNAPLVLANGAVVYDLDKNKIIYQDKLAKKSIKELLSVLKSRNDMILILADPTRYYAILPKDTSQAPIIYFDCETTEYEKIKKLSFIKAIAFVNENSADEIKEIITSLPSAKGINVIPSSKNLIEIVNKEVNKGQAIKIAIHKMQLSYGKLYAIGDYYNDLEMLRIADVSAAPGNAHPNVKIEVDHVVSNHDEDAVAHFIAKIMKAA